MEDIIYFELNNWFAGRDYPDAEPFLSWMGDDANLQFQNTEWVKEQKLCVVESVVDMSLNYCITAPKSWVEVNCPELLTKYTQFIRKPDEDEEDEPPIGRFSCPFLEYSEENIGIRCYDIYEGCWDDYDYSENNEDSEEN